jgi:hypothetical protein
MPPKRRRSNTADEDESISKKIRTRDPHDHLSALSDELLIRILHLLPISALLNCHLLSHRLYRLSSDSQIWKNLYYNRFVLPRALRIPGIRQLSRKDDLHFSSRKSKWLDESNLLESRKDGEKTNWKRQYKLRHNWSIGACEVQEIRVKNGRGVERERMLVKLAEGVVVTADAEDGLRAWDLKGKGLIAKKAFGKGEVPTCLALDEQESDGLGIAVGLEDGGWATWRLDVARKVFVEVYRHPASSNGTLSAIAYGYPYVLTITEGQLLSLYSFVAAPVQTDLLPGDQNTESKTEVPDEPLSSETRPKLSEVPDTKDKPDISSQPRLLASLKSHTSWPPLSLSIRTTPNTLIASIAYSLPTFCSGYTIGLQELHLSPSTGLTTFSRLTSALPQGFSSILSTPSSSPSRSGTSTPTQNNSWSQTATSPRAIDNTRPTTLSYSHPYILATHPDNTLTLYLCTSTSSNLSITPGTKLWGHTSEVSAAEITPRGKAVSVSLRGEELRVWELEGGSFASSSAGKLRRVVGMGNGNRGLERSVVVRGTERSGEIASGDSGGTEDQEAERRIMKGRELERYEEEVEASKRWVGFDDEMVIVLKESGQGTQALMVYDFT